jgi:hypothetical protein
VLQLPLPGIFLNFENGRVSRVKNRHRVHMATDLRDRPCSYSCLTVMMQLLRFTTFVSPRIIVIMPISDSTLLSFLNSFNTHTSAVACRGNPLQCSLLPRLYLKAAVTSSWVLALWTLLPPPIPFLSIDCTYPTTHPASLVLLALTQSVAMASGSVTVPPGKAAAPLNFIYACSVCCYTLADIYEGHDETVGGFSDGINPRDRIVTHLYLASCCHVFCGSHLENGG